MTRIRMAHVRIQGVDCAIFEANSKDNSDAGRDEVLAELTLAARAEGLRVDKAALAFGRRFYGTADLVRYLAGGGAYHWTHTLTV